MFNASFLLLNLLIGFLYKIHIVDGIIGGYSARPGQFKYAVSIQAYLSHNYDRPAEKRNMCSGVIVTDDNILTAAHCVISGISQFINLEWSVIVGAIDPLEKDNIEVNVSKIIVPLDYNPRQDDSNVKISIYSNLALLKLEKKLGLASHTRKLIAVVLPPLFSTTVTHIEETAIIAGFGLNKRTEEIIGKSDIRTPLHYAETIIIPNSWCQLMTNDSIGHDHICGQLNNRPYFKPPTITKGDGGAPLVINGNLLIGILNHSKKHHSGMYSVEVYTKVAYYLPFIYAAMQGQKLPDNRVAIYEYKNTDRGWKKSIKEI